MDKPIFIKLLEHGEEVGLSGTDFDQVLDWAFKNHIISSTQKSEDEVALLRDLFFECFAQNSSTTAEIWVLKIEYYFRLLEYKELSEARKNSNQANRKAIIAIVIAVIAMISSILMGYLQLTGEISINEMQILSINKNIENQSVKIGKTFEDGFSEIVDQMKSQFLDTNKNPYANTENDGDNPNKANAAGAKSSAAD